MSEDPRADLAAQCRSRWSSLGFATRTVAVNGIDFHVAEGGSGEPLLLLHGYPQSGETWRSVAPRLANSGRRVVIPDLRGMGLSGITPDGYELPQLADDIHQIARQLGITDVDVVGHDWGGAVAAVYALSHRAEVRRLAFIESALGGAGFEDVWSFTQPNPAMTFIPLLLSGELTEQLITGREEVYPHHLWDTFTANKDRGPIRQLGALPGGAETTRSDPLRRELLSRRLRHRRRGPTVDRRGQAHHPGAVGGRRRVLRGRSAGDGGRLRRKHRCRCRDR
jgi:pimeloyl-ACP methyl ester carboxylesterase